MRTGNSDESKRIWNRYTQSEELENLQALLKRYGIATVPAIFVSENGTAKVVCDSSLSEDDILDFIS